MLFNLNGDKMNYENEKNLYNEVIESLKQLLDYLGFDDALKIFIATRYIVYAGYLSKDKNYKYSLDRNFIDNEFRTSIMDGTGVCLNESDLLRDVFVKMGYETCNVQNKRGYDDRENFITSKITDIVGNHVCVFVKDNYYNYIYDMTNFCCYKLKNHKKAYSVNKKNIINLKYAFYKEAKGNYKLIKQTNFDNKIISFKEIDDFRIIKKEVKKQLRNNFDILDHFYEYNKNKIEEIANSINRLKKAK